MRQQCVPGPLLSFVGPGNETSQYQNLHDSDASGKKAGLIRHRSSSLLQLTQHNMQATLLLFACFNE